jgi:hypothetical protein
LSSINFRISGAAVDEALVEALAGPVEVAGSLPW